MAWLDWGQVVNLGGTDTSQTVTGLDIGAADPNRWVLVAVIGIGNAGNNITSVTVGGVTATQLIGGNQPPFAAFYKANVTSGTTANVVVNYNGTFYSTSVAVARFIGEIQYSSVHVDLTITSSAHSVSINVPSDGYAYGISHWYNTTATVSWSGLTEDFEGSTSSLYFSGASLAFPSGATGETITTTYTSAPSQNDILAVVTFTVDPVTHTGTGAVTAPAATVSGSGTVTPATVEHTGSGDVDGTAATVAGAAEREVTGAGAVNAPAATVAGTGERAVTGSGSDGIRWVGRVLNSWINTGSPTLDFSALSLPVGAAIQDGDYLLAFVASEVRSDPTIGTVESGWTKLADLYGNDTYDVNLAVFARHWSTGDATSVEFTGLIADRRTLMTGYVLRGVNQATPLDVAVATAVGSNSGRPNPPSLTPVTPGTVVVAAGCGATVSTGTQFLTSAELENSVQYQWVSSTSGVTSLVGMMPEWDGVSAVDPAQFTDGPNSVSSSWAAITIALRSAGEGGVQVAATSVAGTGTVEAGTVTHTGTGAVDATAATVAGTAEREVTGTGAISVAAASVAGTGERAVTGSGAIDVTAATVAGTGERNVTGTGAITVAAAAAAGAAEREIKGTGAVSIAAATVNGAAEGIISGTGVVVAPAATVSGTATREINLPTVTVSPSPFLGVAFPTSDTSTYAFLGENGFGHIRIGAQWSLIQPSEGTWSWDGLDGRVAAIVAAGMQPLLTIASNASWAVDPGDQTSLNKMPVDIADWELFVGTLAARYDGSVYNYQLANEFAGLNNASGGWASTKEDLVTYIDAAYAEIKANASGTTVYMGGVASLVADIYIVNQELATFEPNQPLSETTEIRYTVAEARSAEMDTLVANRLEYPLANATFDAASVHLYGDRSYDPLRISAIQSAAGGVPIITTETGAPTWTGVDPTDEELFVAAVMPTLGALADGIGIAFWFRDYGGDTTFYNQHVPLRDDLGDPKPSMWALRLLAMHLVDGAVVEEYDTDVYLVRNTPFGDTLFGYWSDMSTAPGIADFAERYVLTDPANGVLQHLGPSETPDSGDFVVARGGVVGSVQVPVATVAGTAEREVTGTGNVVAFVAVTGGTASREVTGTGAVVVPFATVAGSEEAEEDAPQQPGGFIPRPIIYVDEDGNPVEPGSEKAEEAVAKVEKAARAAVKAAPPRQKQEVKAAVDRAAEQIAAGTVARIAAEDAAMLLAQLRRIDEQLAALIRQQMDDDEAAAVLLLFAA